MTADYVFWSAIAFMAGCSVYFGPRIKADRMAMQWGLDGKPRWYAPKVFGLYGLVALALAVRFLIRMAVIYIPEKVHGVEVGLILLSVIVACAHLFTLQAAARSS
jgi:hypothetical protein